MHIVHYQFHMVVRMLKNFILLQVLRFHNNKTRFELDNIIGRGKQKAAVIPDFQMGNLVDFELVISY